MGFSKDSITIVDKKDLEKIGKAIMACEDSLGKLTAAFFAVVGTPPGVAPAEKKPRKKRTPKVETLTQAPAETTPVATAQPKAPAAVSPAPKAVPAVATKMPKMPGAK